MRLLLLSNSTNVGMGYLEYPKEAIRDFFADKVNNILFIPYAGVSISFDDYTKKVKDVFAELGYNIYSIHEQENPREAIKNAEAIAVGGGNTFNLLKMLYDNEVVELIKEKVKTGTPYIGWSAGSNMACPTIRTTNDMPIVEPKSFNALNLIPFQINPHYLDAHPEGHGGETREMRIEEFLELNKDIYVVGLREGTILNVEEEKMNLIGERNARLFKSGLKPRELTPKEDFSFLLKPMNS